MSAAAAAAGGGSLGPSPGAWQWGTAGGAPLARELPRAELDKQRQAAENRQASKKAGRGLPSGKKELRAAKIAQKRAARATAGGAAFDAHALLSELLAVHGLSEAGSAASGAHRPAAAAAGPPAHATPPLSTHARDFAVSLGRLLCLDAREEGGGGRGASRRVVFTARPADDGELGDASEDAASAGGAGGAAAEAWVRPSAAAVAEARARCDAFAAAVDGKAVAGVVAAQRSARAERRARKEAARAAGHSKKAPRFVGEDSDSDSSSESSSDSGSSRGGKAAGGGAPAGAASPAKRPKRAAAASAAGGSGGAEAGAAAARPARPPLPPVAFVASRGGAAGGDSASSSSDSGSADSGSEDDESEGSASASGSSSSPRVPAVPRRAAGEDGDDEEDEDDEALDSHAGLGSLCTAFAAQASLGLPVGPGVALGTQPAVADGEAASGGGAAVPTVAPASWEAHTRGVGSRLMAAMGYRGGALGPRAPGGAAAGDAAGVAAGRRAVIAPPSLDEDMAPKRDRLGIGALKL